MAAFRALVQRDLRLAVRQGGATVLVLIFFVLAVTLFPLGVGPAPEVLSRIAPGVLWVAALLSALMSLERLFQADFADGTLDILALGRLPMPVVVLAKALAHWLTAGLPLTLLGPPLALSLALPVEALGAAWIAMALGTPCLTLLGAIGAALTVGVRRGGPLLALLVLPLYIPTLIFGAAAVDAAAFGLAAVPHLLLLGATLCVALVLAPWAAAAALRLSLE
ncbi:heme exporter protein CcmB [Marinibaculum pumilum]|uniref:Heme exporter protein B n=1 Tax=Marinibaculum pumilum TaxID=1766165 RepID=A0ABV7KXZ2_9PROT